MLAIPPTEIAATELTRDLVLPKFGAPGSLHVAVIMDGNGRWAQAKGMLRTHGHRAGVDSLIRIVEAAPEAGVGILTVFAFSSDNWRRPALEVRLLMRLFSSYLQSEVRRCVSQGVRLQVIGRRDRLGASLCETILHAEKQTAAGRRLCLRLAVDYSGRDAILRAARNSADPTRDSIEAELGPSVDLLIRTGGEYRLSDFLLWECAYAELFFTKTMWPDFSESNLQEAISDYRCRERRFGLVPMSGAEVRDSHERIEGRAATAQARRA